MVFGAGIEPATLGLRFRCSIQLSYPKATCRSRTGDQWINHRSTSELTSGGNSTSRPQAYATAVPCAPDGNTIPYRWRPLSTVSRLTPLSKRQFLHRSFPRRPRPAPGRSACAPRERNFPVSGHSVPGCLGSGSTMKRCANAQSKTPPARCPRAFAFLGDRCNRSPQGKISRSGGAIQPRHVAAQRTRRRCARFALQAGHKGVEVAGIHGRRLHGCRTSRLMGAHITCVIFIAQGVFAKYFHYLGIARRTCRMRTAMLIGVADARAPCAADVPPTLAP